MCRQSLFRSWRLQEVRHSNFATIGTRMWQGCQPYAPAAFTSMKYFWRHTAAGGTTSMNNSNDTMRYRTRDLLSYSAVPQGTEPPRELQGYVVSMKYIYIYIKTCIHPMCKYIYESLSFLLCQLTGRFVEQVVGKLKLTSIPDTELHQNTSQCNDGQWTDSTCNGCHKLLHKFTIRRRVLLFPLFHSQYETMGRR
jgi:hypothetical protein